MWFRLHGRLIRRSWVRVPAGDYTIHAGRGFEYGVATARVSVKAGDTVRQALTIHREVPTEGYVSCDTHVHTLTYSGHGDASADERVVTLAGEGIELPIITEHNRQLGPSWVTADRVELYANGRKIREARIVDTSPTRQRGVPRWRVGLV